MFCNYDHTHKLPVNVFLATTFGPRIKPTSSHKAGNEKKKNRNSFFIQLPLKMEPIEGSESSDFRTQDAGELPKRKYIHKEHGESLKSIKSRNRNAVSHWVGDLSHYVKR